MAENSLTKINLEFLNGLELLSNKIYPLDGGTGERLDQDDQRVKDSAKVGSSVCFYEHVATVRHKASGQFFIGFRETMDAFLARQLDYIKYPKWLMDDPMKQKERRIYIYLVTRHPKTVPVLRSHEDWLAPIADDSIFNALTYFLTKHGIVKDSITNY